MVRCRCDQDEPPAKRQRLDVFTDPLKLPEPCAMRILRYLTPNELLKATEVSDKWKYYIESRHKLMNRAMNGTVININFDSSNFSELHSTQFGREYKNMKITSYSDSLRQTVSAWLLKPAFRQSAVLETLRISLNFNVFAEFFEHEFSNLVKLDLRCYGPPFGKIPKHKFPELTTLKIESTNFTQIDLTSGAFKRFLRAFPKLQHLQIMNVESANFLYDDKEKLGSTPDPTVPDPAQPKLETIELSFQRYFPKFLRNHSDSLTKLRVNIMDTLNLSLCLRDLKKLKSLSVTHLKRTRFAQDITFSSNDSIEVLKIHENQLRSSQFHEILLAFTSLRELAVNWSTKSYRVDIRFLGKIFLIALKIYF